MTGEKHPAGHVLQAYFDGELDAAAVAEVKTHCEQCPACEAELADLGRINRMLAAVPTPELPRSVWRRVRPGSRQEPRFKPAFGFAACAAGIVLGIVLGPVQFGADKANTPVTWSETVTIWDGGASTSLLGVYQSAQD